MSKKELIDKTLQTLQKLPADKISEVSDFADFILKKAEEETISKGIQKIVTDDPAFSFLQEEEEIYTVKDLKERYK
jgi:hypothetical protein